MEEKPPLFNSWNAWYCLVLGFMLVQVILFALLTNAFN
jgi:hypothetical protein